MQNTPASYCPNCDALLVGSYCYDCGQAVPKRITWRSFTTRFFERYLDIDQGIPNTIWQLLINPGKVGRNYLSGQRARYTDPVKFMLIAVSVVTIVIINTDIMTDYTAGFVDGYTASGAKVRPDIKVIQDGMYTKMLEYMQAWLLMFVPFATFFGWLIFKQGRYNMAEHFIFMCFVYGMQNWIGLPFWLIFAFFTKVNGYWMTGITIISLGYSVYAFISFYQPKSIVIGLIQSVSTVVLSYIGFIIMFMILIGIYMVVMIKEGKLDLNKGKKKASVTKQVSPAKAKPTTMMYQPCCNLPSTV